MLDSLAVKGSDSQTVKSKVQILLQKWFCFLINQQFYLVKLNFVFEYVKLMSWSLGKKTTVVVDFQFGWVWMNLMVPSLCLTLKVSILDII